MSTTDPDSGYILRDGSGRKKVKQQALMTANCKNIKKIANIMAKKAR